MSGVRRPGAAGSLVVAGLLATGLACGSGSAMSAQDRPQVGHAPHGAVDTTPRVLVLTAMDSELAPLLERADVERTETVNGRTHHIGRLGGEAVVMAASGISMVNATMAAQAAIDRFALRAIVYCGIAGTPSPEVGIGDVTIPGRWAQYQEHVFTDASRTGWRRGWRNGNLGNFGMMHPQRVWTLSEGGPADEQELQLWFPTSPDWMAAAAAVRDRGVSLERCNTQGHCAEADPRVLVGGGGVSGPTFVDDPSYRQFIWDTFEADALDMETAAVAHVARTHDIPYVAVRAISDLAGGNPGENRVTSWLTLAAGNAAATTEALLAEWGARTDSGEAPATGQQTPATATLQVEFIGNAGFRISDGTTTLLSDFPYRSGAFGYMEYDLATVDELAGAVSLVTHEHADHWEPELWRARDWRVVAAPSITAGLREDRVVSWADRIELDGVVVVPVRTSHTEAHHSYRVEWGGLRLYFTGDTEDLESLLDQQDLDAAFVTPWLVDDLARTGQRVDADLIVVYHHTVDREIPRVQETWVPQQGEVRTLDRRP